jgi:Cap4 dsDNA endonuclease
LNSTPDKERSEDKGAETLQHYQYQHSYICLLSIRLYAEEKDPDSKLLLKEIMCEHHEDALGITKDNRFVGIQIKSRIKEIPLTLLDKEVKHSVKRFIQLERKYPNQFVKFVIVSNCPFLDDESGKSIMNLLRQVKSQNGIKIEFKPKDIGKVINNLIDDGYSCEEIINVLRKVQCHKGPGLDDIDSKIIEQHIGKLPLCQNLPALTLRSIYDKLRLLISDASSKKVPNSFKDYKPFVINSEQKEIQVENKAKCITKEKVEEIISKIIKESNEPFTPQTISQTAAQKLDSMTTDKLQDATNEEIEFYIDRIRTFKSSVVQRSAWNNLELLARKKRLWRHNSIWDILKNEIQVENPKDNTMIALYLLKHMLVKSKEKPNSFDFVSQKCRQIFLARFKEIISSVDQAWYKYKTEVKQILQEIASECELFRLLWHAWKRCIYIDSNKQYEESVRAFLNSLSSFIKNPNHCPQDRRSIEIELYKLAESSSSQIASRCEDLLA